MSKDRKYSRCGFTMIEVLIAMILLATVGVGLLLVFLNIGKVAQGSGKQSWLAAGGEDVALKMTGKVAVKNFASGGALAVGTYPSGGAPENADGMFKRWEIKQVSSGGVVRNYRKMEITTSDTQ